MTASDHTLKPFKNHLHQRGHPYMFQAHGPDTWSRVVFRKKAERRLGAAPDDGNDPWHCLR